MSDELARHRAMMCESWRWPHFPFLPLIRDCSAEMELGVLVDCKHFQLGLRPSVFRANLLIMPHTRCRLLSLPREDFDSIDAVLAAGWRVD